jgi:hypothetical protein
MITPSIKPPQGHGELLTQPEYHRWAELLRCNADAAACWEVPVAGSSLRELRVQARREALAVAAGFSERLKVPLRSAADPERLLVMTGHQPELFHPGIWIKNFLLQRIADDTGAAALNLVVDSDGFEVLEVRSPRMSPHLSVSRHRLAAGAETSCYALTPVPSQSILRGLREDVAHSLSTLRAPALGCHFAQFCDALDSARGDAENLAELITLARRRYEVPARTNYLELPITRECRTRGFLSFFVDIALRGEQFFSIYNDELESYRRAHRTRSAAQPFPNLERAGDLWELPFWHITAGTRLPVFLRPAAKIQVIADGAVLVELPRDPQAAIETLARSTAWLAPKAIPLTLYNRLFVADLFLHGAGGARYDRVTDAIIESFYGLKPPRFVVASMTMYLPLGARVVTEREIDEAERRLERLRHNPDQLLDEVEFEEAAERQRAGELATEKSELLAAIGEPDADKKALGKQIRELNEELSALLAPLAESWKEELAELREERAASEILTDRTYPFCFWSPLEIQDKVR